MPLVWQELCNTMNPTLRLLKRGIENYLHPNAIVRSGQVINPFDDFTDMKALYGENVYKVIRDMSCDEILASDKYKENGVEHHELKEIVLATLSLTGDH